MRPAIRLPLLASCSLLLALTPACDSSDASSGAGSDSSYGTGSTGGDGSGDPSRVVDTGASETGTDTGSVDDTADVETDPGLVAGISLSPSQPVPERPLTLTVALTTDAGAPITGAEVWFTASLGEHSFDLQLTEGDAGTYQADLVFDLAGTWTVTVTVDAEAALEQDVVVACDHGGAEAAACCTHEHCAAGLWCVSGSCDTSLLEVGAACGDAMECASGHCPEGVCEVAPGYLLGSGPQAGSPWTVILATGLAWPTDLAFSPDNPDELWVTSRASDQLTVIEQAGEPDQTASHFYDGSQHFLEEVTSIAFGDSGTFATCGESDNSYGGFGEANYFMGPALWPSSKVDFQIVKYAAHEAHLDMLHSSSFCVGVAAVTKNQFFAFNGADATLDWYDFREPHCPGCDDHSDGKKARYADVKLTYKPGVPSNMHVDLDTLDVFIADTGASRVIRVDLGPAQFEGFIPSFFLDGTLSEMTGSVTMEIVSAASGELMEPSGMAFHEDIIYVADYATGWIKAFTWEGELVNSLDTGLGPGALGGLTVGPDERLYVADMDADRVLRIDP